MKQLELFYKKLESAGLSYTINWEKVLKTRNHILQHITVNNDVNFTNCMIQIYGENKGFDIYIQSMSIDINILIGNIKKSISINN